MGNIQQKLCPKRLGKSKSESIRSIKKCESIRSITKCESIESIHFSDDYVEENISDGFTINSLPNEMIEHVFKFVSPYNDWKNCSLVCKRWYRIIKGTAKETKKGFEEAVASYNVYMEAVTADAKPHICNRYCHSAVLVDNSMYVFGGCSPDNAALSDLWCLDLRTRQWTKKVPATDTFPAPRACSTLVHYKKKLYLYGGRTYQSLYFYHHRCSLLHQLCVYDLDKNSWSCISMSPIPPLIAAHSATVQNNLMVVFGGIQKISEDDYLGTNSVYCFNLESSSWQEQATTNYKPEGRYSQSQLSLDENNILILGGCGRPNTVFNDVWLLSLTKPVWTWRKIVIENAGWAAPELWCHPATKVGDLVVVLSCTTNSDIKSLLNSDESNTKQNADRFSRRYSQLVRRNSADSGFCGTSSVFPLASSSNSSSDECMPSSSSCYTSSLSGRAPSPLKYSGSANLSSGHSSDNEVDGDDSDKQTFTCSCLLGSSGSNFNKPVNRFQTLRLKFLPNTRTVVTVSDDGPSFGLRHVDQANELENQIAYEMRMDRLRYLTYRKQSPVVQGEVMPKPHFQVDKVACMFILDVSQVLSANSHAQWLQPKTISGQEQEDIKMNSFITGKAELIAFGGVLEEIAPSVTHVKERVSNSLYFIKPCYQSM